MASSMITRKQVAQYMCFLFDAVGYYTEYAWNDPEITEHTFEGERKHDDATAGTSCLIFVWENGDKWLNLYVDADEENTVDGIAIFNKNKSFGNLDSKVIESGKDFGELWEWLYKKPLEQ